MEALNEVVGAASDAVEVLYGPIYHRLLLHTRALTGGQVESVLDLVFTGLRPEWWT
jgi:hypothetical protein